MSLLYLLPFLGIFTLAQSGNVVWSGNFDYYTDVSTFDLWSWSNEVGEYQWYIHGSNATSSYLATGSAYKNPADTWESVGLSLTIDVNAVWNNDGMERTELIPQSSVSLGTGQMYYHFSLYLDPDNLPDSTIEHQIFFFESHAVQLKYGVSPSPTNLVFLAGSTTYVIETTPGTWMNFAYDLDFTTGYAGLWYSTGSNDLVQVVAPVSAGVSTNSEDFHVGVLKLSVSGNPEVYYISGVYIESGTITTSVAGPGGSVSSSSTTSSSKSQTTTTTSSSKSQTTTTTSSSKSQTTTKSSTTTTKTTATPTTTSGACSALYGQCGGIGWSGATCCSSGTCQDLNAYYYQCLN